MAHKDDGRAQGGRPARGRKQKRHVSPARLIASPQHCRLLTRRAGSRRAFRRHSCAASDHRIVRGFQAAPIVVTALIVAGQAYAARVGTPAPLQAEANAQAAGDIPDNQVFLTFTNTRAGYALKFPEGWAQQGAGGHVSFRDKNNIVRVVVAQGGPRTAAQIRAGLAGVRVLHLPHGGREAVLDLGTPVGVDNVDAYRLMIESYRWR